MDADRKPKLRHRCAVQNQREDWQTDPYWNGIPVGITGLFSVHTIRTAKQEPSLKNTNRVTLPPHATQSGVTIVCSAVALDRIQLDRICSGRVHVDQIHAVPRSSRSNSHWVANKSDLNTRMPEVTAIRSSISSKKLFVESKSVIQIHPPYPYHLSLHPDCCW